MTASANHSIKGGVERFTFTGAGVSVALTVEGETPTVESFERVDQSQPPADAPPTPEPGQAIERRDLVGEFLEVMAQTAIEGRVPEAVWDFRFQCCTGTTRSGVVVGAPCPQLVDGDGRRVESMVDHRGALYCGACGCWKWRLARLDKGKLRHPGLRCPRGRYSAVHHDAGRVTPVPLDTKLNQFAARAAALEV